MGRPKVGQVPHSLSEGEGFEEGGQYSTSVYSPSLDGVTQTGILLSIPVTFVKESDPELLAAAPLRIQAQTTHSSSLRFVKLKMTVAVRSVVHTWTTLLTFMDCFCSL